MFCAGDLIRVPSNVGLYKTSNNSVQFFIKTQKPRMGIFVEYENSNECTVNVDGQNWTVKLQHIRIMREQNDKTSTNN
jgi:hypothetical protein